MLRVVAAHVPPPPGAPSPIRWGSESYVRELLGDRVETIVSRERTFTFRFRSAGAFVDYFRTYYGPTVKAFEAAGRAGGDDLFGDLVDLIHRYARASSGSVGIPATYLETVAVRAA